MKRRANKKNHPESEGFKLLPGSGPRHAIKGQGLLRHQIEEYVLTQSPPGTKIHYAEQVHVEKLHGKKYEVWDVHASDGRWWVINNPTNLYSQNLIPSMDYAISFHIGLMMRVMAAPTPGMPRVVELRLSKSWRKWEQAAQAFEEGEEPEEFQAVGMRCREALLSLVREAAHERSVPFGSAPPKRGDFLGWSEIVCNWVSPGSSGERLRGYLKATSKASWEFVQWLTHNSRATRADAQVAVDATHNVMASWSMALLKAEKGEPEKCPFCESYKMVPIFKPERGFDDPYAMVCENCGTEGIART